MNWMDGFAEIRSGARLDWQFACQLNAIPNLVTLSFVMEELTFVMLSNSNQKEHEYPMKMNWDFAGNQFGHPFGLAICLRAERDFRTS